MVFLCGVGVIESYIEVQTSVEFALIANVLSILRSVNFVFHGVINILHDWMTVGEKKKTKSIGDIFGVLAKSVSVNSLLCTKAHKYRIS